ncbi:hypothetical protein K438DRAFT_1991483 [Mycena galopus ATCC 62051]|nr:hypothetical protein K438DRAFT_1991483 [Mycena galopus ATCC 62051]
MEHGVVKSTSEALTLLAILSILPAGTTGAALRWWAPTLTSPSAAVGTLRTAALKGHGHFETTRIFVRPTIQSYMSHQGRIASEIRDEDDLTALASEQTYIRGILMETPVHAPRPNAYVKVVRYPDVDAATRRLAEAHRCLGKALLALDQYEEACPHFDKARDRFKSLTGVPTSTAPLESFPKATQTDLCHDESERYHVARGLLGFGRFLWVWRPDRLDEALETLSTAKAIFEERDCLGERFLLIASVHARR